MAKTELRMDAYYFSFTPTGVREIDLILCAVASAGKAFHHTEGWVEDYEGVAPLSGPSPAEWIQNAANAAAQRSERAEAALLSALSVLDRWGHDEHCARWLARVGGVGDTTCDCNISEEISGGDLSRRMKELLAEPRGGK